jgi:hypothetical protein
MDSVLLNVLVLAFLGIIIIGIINMIYIKENTSFSYIIPKGESIRLDNSKVLWDSIISVDIIYREEGSLLV